MERRYPKLLLIIVLILLASALGCTSGARSTAKPAGDEHFDEVAFWESLPLPEDAEDLTPGQGFDLGFATRMIEPELFDFYAAWLRQQGWRQQAPTEAMVTPPHQVWRKDKAELLIEIRGLDEKGRTVVLFQVEER